MSEEQSPFAKAGSGLGGSSAPMPSGDSGAIYSEQTAGQVLIERGLFITTKVNMLITLILCIVRAAMKPVNAGLYVMYGLSLCLLLGLEVYIIQLARHGELGNSRRWFVYMFVIFLFIECICTDILVFQ